MHQVLLQLDMQHNLEVQQLLHIRHCQRVRPRQGMLRELAQQLRQDTRHCQAMHRVLHPLDMQHNRGVRLKPGMLRELALQLNLVMQRYQERHRTLPQLLIRRYQRVQLRQDMRQDRGLRLNQVMQRYLELHQHLQVEPVSIQQGLSRVEHSGQLVILQEAHSLAERSLATDQD